MKRKGFQQGDVLFIPVDASPEGKKIPAQVHRGHKSLVFAEGEATGHAHRIDLEEITDPRLDDMELIEEDGVLYLKMPEDTQVDVVHEEHGTITLPGGDYEIRRVREYDHLREEIRAIRD